MSNSVVTGGLAAMASVALLIGLALVIRWVSPLATGLPGLLLLGWTALYVVSPARAVDYIPLKGHSFGLGFAGLGTTGILGAAGVILGDVRCSSRRAGSGRFPLTLTLTATARTT